MSSSSLSLVSIEAEDRSQTELELTSKIMLAGRRWRTRFAERLKSIGQTDGRWSTLHCLADCRDGIIQNDLAERVGVAGPSLVRLIDALEAQGLVSRRSAPNDRRAKIVVMEPEGRRLLVELDRVAAELRDEIFEGLTLAEIQTAHFVMTRVSSRLK